MTILHCFHRFSLLADSGVRAAPCYQAQHGARQLQGRALFDSNALAPRCRATRADNFGLRPACIRLGGRLLYVLCSALQLKWLCSGRRLEHSKATGARVSCFPLIALQAQRNLRPQSASSNPESAPVTHGLGVRPPAKSCLPAHRNMLPPGPFAFS
jgi:hypothetical protein